MKRDSRWIRAWLCWAALLALAVAGFRLQPPGPRFTDARNGRRETERASGRPSVVAARLTPKAVEVAPVAPERGAHAGTAPRVAGKKSSFSTVARPDRAPAAASAPAAGRAALPAGAIPGSAGMVVAIDPETGALGTPSPEQLRALGLTSRELEAVSRSTEGLIEIHRPDGAVGVNLRGRFQDYTVVRIGPGGSRVFRCLQAGEKPVLPADSLALPERFEEQ